MLNFSQWIASKNYSNKVAPITIYADLLHEALATKEFYIEASGDAIFLGSYKALCWFAATAHKRGISLIVDGFVVTPTLYALADWASAYTAKVRKALAYRHHSGKPVGRPRLIRPQDLESLLILHNWNIRPLAELKRVSLPTMRRWATEILEEREARRARPGEGKEGEEGVLEGDRR